MTHYYYVMSLEERQVIWGGGKLASNATRLIMNHQSRTYDEPSYPLYESPPKKNIFVLFFVHIYR